MNPIGESFGLFQNLSDLASNFAKTQDSSYLEKMNSLIKERLSFLAPREREQLKEIKEKLIQAQVSPDSEIIQTIDSLSKSLQKGIGFEDFSDIEVFQYALLTYLNPKELIQMQGGSQKLKSHVEAALKLPSFTQHLIERHGKDIPTDHLVKLICTTGKQLTHLDLSGRKDLKPSHLEVIANNCPNLQVLNLADNGIKDIDLQYLALLPNLQQLNLKDCDNLNGNGLAHLGKLTSLTSLNLLGCHMTDADLGALSDLKNLKQIEFSGYDVTDTGLSNLAQLTNLERLRFSNCEITNEGLAKLAPLNNLKQLDITGISEITHEGLARLNLKNLEQLNLINCYGVTDAVFSLIAASTQLQQLSLEGCKITNAGLEHLKGLTNLKQLNLAVCRGVTDVGIAEIAKSLKKLEQLNLRACEGVTDGGVAHLKRFKELRQLVLEGCWKITDGGLTHLKALKQLEELNLKGCNRVTNEGMVSLLAASKNLKLITSRQL